MIIIKQIFLKQRANSNYYFMNKSEHDFLVNKAVRFFVLLCQTSYFTTETFPVLLSILTV